MAPVAVYLERGSKRTFACAVAWPGWARSGKTEEAALGALSDYADRYASVVERTKHRIPAEVDLHVVEVIPGGMTTDFGAPGEIPALDRMVLAAADARQQIDLLRACWSTLDDVIAAAPAELRKGPRGGGRDRDQVAQHVLEAERAYAAKIGVRQKPFDFSACAELATFRGEIVKTLLAGDDFKWPTAYAIRRIAWHVLDHAWEIEDKS
jgi:hypothetical protein